MGEEVVWDPVVRFSTAEGYVQLSASTSHNPKLERQRPERAVDAGNVLFKHVYLSR